MNEEIIKQPSKAAETSQPAKMPPPKLTPPKSNVEEVPGEQSQELGLPVMSRMRKRLKVIREKSSAKTVKYPRGSKHHHVTEAPQMFISELTPVLVNSNYGTITYGVYSMDENGNKLVKESWETNDEGKRRLVDSQHVLEKTVVETFEFRKAGVIETFDEGNY